MPLVGYYKVLTKNQADAGNDVFPTLVNYGNWRLAWYAFLSLLDINFKDGFTCEHCGCEPRTIVCDATNLGFQRKFTHIASPKKNETYSGIVHI